MKTRWLSAALALCMLLALVPATALAAETENRPAELAAEHPFTDVPADHWANDAVAYVYENGLMSGVDETTFSPNGTTTRAMIVTVLYRMAGEPAVSGGGKFTDVDPNAWYGPAVAWAAANDIVTGVSATSFAPNNPITREQMATMLGNYLSYLGHNTQDSPRTPFTDEGQVSAWALDGVRCCAELGLLGGVSADRFSPRSVATRAQAAQLLQRLYAFVYPGEV